jgi:hypothetical protein
MTDTQAVYAAPVAATEPCGDLSIRTPAMPADTNQNGDIFGGWLLSQMDIGGGIFASKVTKSRSYGRDRGDEFSQTRVRRRCGFGLRQPGADRQDFHHRPSRSLDPAPPGTNSILTATSLTSRSTIRGSRKSSSRRSCQYRPDMSFSWPDSFGHPRPCRAADQRRCGSLGQAGDDDLFIPVLRFIIVRNVWPPSSLSARTEE